MSDFEAILKAYAQSGGDPSFLKSSQVASLIISGNTALGLNRLPGMRATAESLPDRVKIALAIDPGVRFENPVPLCFGVVPKEGVQRILSPRLTSATGPASSLPPIVRSRMPR